MKFISVLGLLLGIGFPTSDAYQHDVPTDYIMRNGLSINRQMEDQSCVSTDIKCVVDGTNGEACEDLVQTSDCSADVTYTFKYCNLSADTFTSDSTSVFKINKQASKIVSTSPLNPGECRTIVKNVTIDTCSSVPAQLKMQGSTDTGEHCYDFSFMYYTPTKVQTNCELSTDIKCVVDGTNGEACEDLTQKSGCSADVTYTFKYCNLSKDTFTSDSTSVIKINKEASTLLNTSPLNPGECRTIVKHTTINTCSSVPAQLKVQGITDSGAHCYDFSFMYYEPTSDKDSCQLSTNIKCVVDGTKGEACEDMIQTSDCTADVTYTFKYCNLSEHIFTSDSTSAIKINKEESKLNTSPLNPGECRTIVKKTTINTCGFVPAQLKVQGLTDTNEHCYDFSFMKFEPTKVEANCALSTDIYCTTADDGDCKNIVTTHDKCGKQDLAMEFKYCNNNLVATVYLNEKTTMKYNDVTEKIGAGNLPPQTCKTISKNINVDTCQWGFNAWIKLEGNIIRQYDACYAFEFEEYTVEKPKAQNKDKCALEANVYCYLSDGSNCDTVTKGVEESGCEIPVKYVYEVCNAGAGNINLTKVVARYDQEIVRFRQKYKGKPLDHNNCINHEEFAVVNICNPNFVADIKAQGPNDLLGWCQNYKSVKVVPGPNPKLPRKGDVPPSIKKYKAYNHKEGYKSPYKGRSKGSKGV